MEPISESRKHALLIASSILVARSIAQIKAKGISLNSAAGNSAVYNAVCEATWIAEKILTKIESMHPNTAKAATVGVGSGGGPRGQD